jgi:hypothetical protein
MPSVVMLSVFTRYAECHYAECRYAECRDASFYFDFSSGEISTPGGQDGCPGDLPKERPGDNLIKLFMSVIYKHS